MFNTPLADVTYEQVLEFCRTFPEGARVEYKREPVNIAKVFPHSPTALAASG